jgi:hypothetical protein
MYTACPDARPEAMPPAWSRQREGAMNRRSWMRRWVSMLAIGGLMLLLNQGSGAAEDAPSTELPYQSDAPTVNRSFLFYGGGLSEG